MKEGWLFVLALALIVKISTCTRISYSIFSVAFKTKFNGPVNLSYTFTKQRGLTKQDKQAILNIHNALRNKLATGKQKTSFGGPMPQAANMMAMEWDDRLAAFAQKWADKCQDDHSDLNVPGDAFKIASMSENICGDYPAIERDMYGEVKDWNYQIQDCRPEQQCGHYVAIASAHHFRVGCGWKVCVQGITKKMLLYCDFAPYSTGSQELLKGETRQPHQYEYRAGPPCSQCPQGWDYCLAGGLCATKKQCESDPLNKCICLNKKDECEENGGVFNSDKCTCKCPGNKFGINCKNQCENPKGIMECGITCGGAAAEFILCPKSCGSCGDATSRAYRYFMNRYPAVNTDGIKTAAYVKNPYVPNNPNLQSLASYGKCKNQEADKFCQNIRLRNYCKGFIDKATWEHFCGLSCNTCNSTAYQRMLENAPSPKDSNVQVDPKMQEMLKKMENDYSTNINGMSDKKPDHLTAEEWVELQKAHKEELDELDKEEKKMNE